MTPEAVLLDFRAAGLGSRLLARCIDLVVLYLLLMTFAVVVGVAVTWVPEASAVAGLLMVAALLLAYPVACESLLRGRTLGKMALGLRVVTREGGPVGFRHSALRGVIGLVEIFMTLGCVAAVSALCTRRSQRFGDLAAGTIVVRERDTPSRALAVAFPPPAGWESYCGSLDVAPVGDEQYGLIRSYLLRVLELTPGARAALALRLAGPTAERMHHVPPPALSPEVFLACVASAYQVRHGGLLVPVWGVPSAPVGLPPPPLPPDWPGAQVGGQAASWAGSPPWSAPTAPTGGGPRGSAGW